MYNIHIHVYNDRKSKKGNSSMQAKESANRLIRFHIIYENESIGKKI